MYRSPLHLFILIILVWTFVGCSSSSQNSVNPITPDEPAWVTDRTMSSMSDDPVNTDVYWSTKIKFNGESWIASLNPNGTIHRATGKGVQESSKTFEVIDNHPEIFLLGSDNFKTESDEVHGGIRYVVMRQTYRDLLVVQSRVDMRYGRGGSLMMVGANVYPDININTNPTFSMESAKELVASEISPDEPFKKAQLTVFVSGDQIYNLAWMIESLNWIHWIDARTGDVLKRQHHYWEAFTGDVYGVASQPDPLAAEVQYPFSNLEMRMSYDANDTYPYYAMPVTNIDGFYTYTDSSYSQLYSEARFYGPYGNCNNRQSFPNNEGQIDQVTYNNTKADFNFTNANSIRSERTAWVWAMAAHDFLKSVEPTYTTMDWRLSIEVNQDAWCNAYANENSINFFRPASGCLDTGIVPDIVIHEWAHVNTFEQYNSYEVPSSMIHEGYSDALPNMMLDTHYIGYNVQGAGTYFRDSENTMKWPAPECGGSGHCLGQILAGSYWDMYQVLGKEYTAFLYHFSRYGKPLSFVDCAFEVLLVDDDDDDWTNGTPNYPVIYESFYINHNVEVPYIEIQEGLTLTLTPAVPDIHVARGGGMFDFDLNITNHSSSPMPFHIWAEVRFTGGGKYGPFVPPGYLWHAPYYFTWTPGQVFDISLYQTVPGGLAPGTFEYHIVAGQYGGEIYDDEMVYVTIDP